MAERKIQWHSAFYAAIQIELEEDKDNLLFEQEHLLGEKPMQIDVVVIKKQQERPIRKDIGHIFRKYNVIEYKSPDDSLSIDDFYKVYGYACFYISDTERVGLIPAHEVTITFVCNKYPRKMLREIQNERGITAYEYAKGIYYLKGDPIPMQLIISKDLSKEDNYWIQNLRKDLKSGGEIWQLVEQYEEKKHSKLYQAVMDVIMRANWKEAEVEKKMCEALRELFAEELEESHERGKMEGRAEGRAEGRMEGIRQIISNMLEVGLDFSQIAKTVNMEEEYLMKLMKM